MPELYGLSTPRFIPTALPRLRTEEEHTGGVAPAEGGRIGRITAVSGAGAELVLEGSALEDCATSADPAVAMAGQVGSQVKVRTRGGWLLASVRDQSRAGSAPAEGSARPNESGAVSARIDFLGEGLIEPATGRLQGFRRGVTRYPQSGAAVHPATSEDLKAIHAGDRVGTVRIGTVYPTQDIAACLDVDALLGRHFALLGSTGTGKSTSLALILHRIIAAAPHGHVLMIDPHGEYGAAFREEGETYDVANLRMPYWLLNFEEHCEVLLTTSGSDLEVDRDILGKCLLAARQASRMCEGPGKVTVDSPVPYLLSDLLRVLNEDMGKLDKASTSAPYMRIRTKIEELRADPRYQFMFSALLVGDTMAEFLARIFRMPGEGKPIAIIDVSGVPSEVTRTVVAVLARMVFDFAVWGRTEDPRPILLVCEEAHRYVPAERQDQRSSAAQVLGRIAKEGRKYGIALGLVTQRPSDLAEGVLSQCGTILAMRLNNERDQAFVKAAMPEGARGFLDSIPALRNRECIICGEGVSIPIRASFDELDERHRPSSADPSFLSLWHAASEGTGALDRIVRRWRMQGG